MKKTAVGMLLILVLLTQAMAMKKHGEITLQKKRLAFYVRNPSPYFFEEWEDPSSEGITIIKANKINTKWGDSLEVVAPEWYKKKWSSENPHFFMKTEGPARKITCKEYRDIVHKNCSEKMFQELKMESSRKKEYQAWVKDYEKWKQEKSKK